MNQYVNLIFSHIDQILEVDEGLVKSRVEKELIDEREGRKVIAFGQRQATKEEEEDGDTLNLQ